MNKLIEHRANESLGGLFFSFICTAELTAAPRSPLHKPGAFRQGDHPAEPKEFHLQERSIFKIYISLLLDGAWGLWSAITQCRLLCYQGLVPRSWMAVLEVGLGLEMGLGLELEQRWLCPTHCASESSWNKRTYVTGRIVPSFPCVLLAERLAGNILLVEIKGLIYSVPGNT